MAILEITIADCSHILSIIWPNQGQLFNTEEETKSADVNYCSIIITTQSSLRVL